LSQRQAELNRLQSLAEENRRLRAAAKLPPLEGVSYSRVEIIARNPLTARKVFVVNRGRSAGLRVGQAVLAQGFLIGRIVEASETTATVRTILDESIKIGIRVRGAGGNGILSGEASGGDGAGVLVKLQYLDRGLELEKGLRVETSGLGGQIPGGILIGTIDSFKANSLTQDARVLLSADFRRLSYLTVVIEGSVQ